MGLRLQNFLLNLRQLKVGFYFSQQLNGFYLQCELLQLHMRHQAFLQHHAWLLKDRQNFLGACEASEQ